MEFIGGVEAELSPRSIGLTIQLVRTRRGGDRGLPALVRRAPRRRRVRRRRAADDPRVEALHALGLPAVVIGGPLAGAPCSLRSGTTRPPSSSRLFSTSRRSAIAGSRGSRAWRSSSTPRARRGRSARRPTRSGSRPRSSSPTTRPRAAPARHGRLLSSPEPPTAIVFDSDLLAVTGLGVAQQMGFDVPDDLSLIGWDDSLISRVVHPPLTAITRDIGAYGAMAARHLLAVLDGGARHDVEVARGELTPRGSTAPPRSAPSHPPRGAGAEHPGRIAVRSMRESRVLDA